MGAGSLLEPRTTWSSCGTCAPAGRSTASINWMSCRVSPFRATGRGCSQAIAMARSTTTALVPERRKTAGCGWSPRQEKGRGTRTTNGSGALPPAVNPGPYIRPAKIICCAGGTTGGWAGPNEPSARRQATCLLIWIFRPMESSSLRCAKRAASRPMIFAR